MVVVVEEEYSKLSFFKRLFVKTKNWNLIIEKIDFKLGDKIEFDVEPIGKLGIFYKIK